MTTVKPVQYPFLEALRDSIATFFAYFPLGIVFGVLFMELGLPWYYAPLMSLVVFAGAVQFVALGIFAAQGSIIGLFITTFMIAFRNSFYGLSLLHRYETGFWRKQYLIFGLVDATYSIVQSRHKRENELPYFLYLTAVIHLYWVTGTFIGAIFGSTAATPTGLEFSLTALFTVFFVEQWKKCKNINVVVVALLGFGLGWLFYPSQAFIIGVLLSTFYLCANYWWKKRRS